MGGELQRRIVVGLTGRVFEAQRSLAGMAQPFLAGRDAVDVMRLAPDRKFGAALSKPRFFNLDLLPAKLQHRKMGKQNETETGLAAAIRGFVRWSITPPQSYAMYVVCLFLITGLSYYAGTLNPKKTLHVAPQSTALPRN
jgi:hypothetical protein